MLSLHTIKLCFQEDQNDYSKRNDILIVYAKPLRSHNNINVNYILPLSLIYIEHYWQEFIMTYEVGYFITELLNHSSKNVIGSKAFQIILNIYKKHFTHCICIHSIYIKGHPIFGINPFFDLALYSIILDLQSNIFLFKGMSIHPQN